jgi:hypothetical protein
MTGKQAGRLDGMYGPSKTRTSGNFLKNRKFKNTHKVAVAMRPQQAPPLRSVGRMSVMWLLLDGKKGVVYQRPEIIGDFLETPSGFPRRRCLIATPLAFSATVSWRGEFF